MLRAVAADEAAPRSACGRTPASSDLIAAADEPWRSILAEHRDAFMALPTRSPSSPQTNRTLITAGLRAAHETLLGIGQGATTYTADGARSPRPTRAAPSVDRSL